MTGLLRRGRQRTRDAATARLQQSERGITLVLFAMATMAVIGMVAVGVDGGRIYDERRQAQNAADHAALAAAYASCTSTLTDPAALQALAEAAGLASAVGNGYDDDGTTNEVTINVVTGGADHTYEAQIDTTIETTFAKVIGFATMDTDAYAEATATGCDETAGGNPAIHAGGHNCPGGSLRNVEISGNDHTVNGMTRTYGSFHNGGDRSDFLNPGLASVEYGGTFTAGPPFNVYDGTPALVSPLPTDRWPDGFDPVTDMTNTMWNAYRDARVNIASLTPSTFNIIANGIYYTERTSGTITINTIAPGAQFVVVSKFRPISIPNAYTGWTFHAYPNNPPNTPDGLMFISGFSHAQPCDQFALERSGEGGTWNGIFWTPRAMSRWSGNLSAINGGFVTWAFQMNGNEHVINGGTGQPAAVPDVLLTQ